MKLMHSIKLTVFSYEHENSDEILNSILKFFPFNLEENRIKLVKRNATGFGDSKIEIFEVLLIKTSLTNEFLDFILEHLDDVQKGTLIQQAESRLDENLDFFIRFDKDSWVKNEKLELTDSGKCFHLKMSVAAFPTKREVALKIIQDIFSK